MSRMELAGWDRLRHGGLLLDMPRMGRVAEHCPAPLSNYEQRELRRLVNAVADGGPAVVTLINFVLETICGFTPAAGTWQRGTQVGSQWGRITVTGETAKPRQI